MTKLRVIIAAAAIAGAMGCGNDETCAAAAPCLLGDGDSGPDGDWRLDAPAQETSPSDVTRDTSDETDAGARGETGSPDRVDESSSPDAPLDSVVHNDAPPRDVMSRDSGTDVCIANACGGCGVLSGAPGDRCGTCGTYACSADRSSVDCVHPDPLPAIAIGAGDTHTCAVLGTGAIRCWGRNLEGELGDNSMTSRSSPSSDVMTDVSDFIAVAGGSSHTCGLRSAGGVRCWGDNTSGQLGTGTYASATHALSGEILGTATAISAMGALSCALLASGQERCWGDNSAGALGDGSIADNRPTPNADVLGLIGITAIQGTCAVASGDVHCWGAGGSGRIGDGSKMDFSIPSPTVLSGASAIASGEGHTCAIVAGGVRCWGFNAVGQLGDGGEDRNVDMPRPTNVVSGSIAVSVGGDFSCAVLDSGGVRCWGGNESGQVGDGTLVNRVTPVDVADLNGVTAIATGAAHACALLSSGKVRCWGQNADGQLGDGTLIDRQIPVDTLPICP